MAETADGGLGEAFPSHDPALVQGIVTVSHGNLARVTELVKGQPALAKVSWDWGFGDWEDRTRRGLAHRDGVESRSSSSANGAPGHHLLCGNARTLDVVKAFIAASPGIERQPGPMASRLRRTHGRAASKPRRWSSSSKGWARRIAPHWRRHWSPPSARRWSAATSSAPVRATSLSSTRSATRSG